MVDEVLRSAGGNVHDRSTAPPLRITTAADPATLAVSRAGLKDWLTAAGVSAEDCADVLLAVGEAAANSTEHAVAGASGPVDITVDARFVADVLQIAVSDTGSWRPASPTSGHRGHGISLMNALMDSVNLTTGPGGTTVTLVKVLAR